MRTSKWQLFRFTLVFLGSQSTMFLIPGLIGTSGYQGWIAIIAGGMLGVVILFFTIQLGKLKPDEAWVDFGGEIMGKWLHRGIVLLLLGWCVYYVSYDIQGFVIFFGSNYLRSTPPLFIQVVIGLVILYTANLGFSTIVYMAEGIFLIFVIATAISTYLFIPNADLAMIPAFFHYHDPAIAVKDSILTTTWFGEWVVFLFVAPELKIGRKMLKRLGAACILLMFIVLVGWVLTMLNFGPYLGKEMKFPYLQIIQGFPHEALLGNSDPILIGLWSASMFIHSSFLIYVANRCAQSLLKQKAKKYTIPVLTLCSMIIAYLYSLNIANYYQDFYSFNTGLFWLFVECIPVYYLIAAYIRSKMGSNPKPQ